MLTFEQCFILFCSFPLLFAFVVEGLGFEFCVFVAGWRHALRSEWPFITIIIIKEAFIFDHIQNTHFYILLPLQNPSTLKPFNPKIPDP